MTPAPPNRRPDIAREVVAHSHPAGADEALRHTDRGAAVSAMSVALSAFLRRERQQPAPMRKDEYGVGIRARESHEIAQRRFNAADVRPAGGVGHVEIDGHPQFGRERQHSGKDRIINRENLRMGGKFSNPDQSLAMGADNFFARGLQSRGWMQRRERR